MRDGDDVSGFTKLKTKFFFFLLLFRKREKYRVAASSGKYMVVCPLNLFVDDNDDALTRLMRFEPGYNGIVRDIRTHIHTHTPADVVEYGTS